MKQRIILLGLIIIAIAYSYWRFHREGYHQYDLVPIGQITLPAAVATHMGAYLLTGQDNTLHIFEFVPPMTFHEIASIDVNIDIEAMWVAGTTAYLFDFSDRSYIDRDIQVIDFSKPQHPQEITAHVPQTTLDLLTSQGTFDTSQAYYYYDDIGVIDLNKPKQMIPPIFNSDITIKVDRRQGGGFTPVENIIEGNSLYFAYYSFGFPQGFPPDLRGIAIYDISQPLSYTIKSIYTPYGEEVPESFSVLADMTVSNQLVYVISEADGLYVVDASDPTSPFETAHYDIKGTHVEVISDTVLVKIATDTWQIFNMQPRWDIW